MTFICVKENNCFKFQFSLMFEFLNYLNPELQEALNVSCMHGRVVSRSESFSFFLEKPGDEER